MRRFYYVLLSGIVLIWIGLSDGSQNAQLVGEAMCLAGFAWLDLGGWRVMQRCAHQMRTAPMSDRPAPSWIYVLTHLAWEGLSMVKIVRIGRNPRTRAAEIISVPGLLALCKIAFCSPVSDMAGAEQTVGDRGLR